MPAFPTATSRIHESLDAALARKRVVLWYDPNGEWASEFDDYQPAEAEKLRVEGNEFSVKVAISRAGASTSASCSTSLPPSQLPGSAGLAEGMWSRKRWSRRQRG